MQFGSRQTITIERAEYQEFCNLMQFYIDYLRASDTESWLKEENIRWVKESIAKVREDRTSFVILHLASYIIFDAQREYIKYLSNQLTNIKKMTHDLRNEAA